MFFIFQNIEYKMIFLKYLSHLDSINCLITVEALWFLDIKIKIKKIKSIINSKNYFWSKNWKIRKKVYTFFKLIYICIRLFLIGKIYINTINKIRVNNNRNLCFRLFLLQPLFFIYLRNMSYIYYNFKNIMLNNFKKKIKISFKKFYKFNINNNNEFFEYDSIQENNLFLFQIVFNFLKIKSDSLIMNKQVIEVEKFKSHNILFVKYIFFLKSKKKYKILIPKLKIHDLFTFSTHSNYLRLLKILRFKLKKIHLWNKESYFFYCDNENESFRASIYRKKSLYLNFLTEKKEKWIMYSGEFIVALHEFLDITFKLKNYSEFYYQKKSKFLCNLPFFNKFKIFILEIEGFNVKNCILNHNKLFFCENRYFFNVKNSTQKFNKIKFIRPKITIFAKNIFLNKNRKINSLYFKIFTCVFLDSIFRKLIILKTLFIFYNDQNYPNNFFIKQKKYLFEIANLIKFAFINFFFFDNLTTNLDCCCLKLDKFWYIYGYKTCLLLDKFSFKYVFEKKNEKSSIINSSNLSEYKTIIYFKRFLPSCERFLRCYHSIFSSFDLFKYIINEEIYRITCFLIKIMENLHHDIYYLMIFLLSQFFIAIGQTGKARVVFILGVLFFINKKKYESNIFIKLFFFFEIIYGTFFSFKNLHKIKRYVSLVHRISFFEYSFF
nr:hypothetical protein Cry52Nrm2_p029 [Cryptomonas curvata]